MAYRTALLQGYTDYLLGDAVVTSTVAPATTYSLDTLLTLQPASRVVFGATTVTITFTWDSARQVDLVALPVSNLDAGTSVLAVTNGSGLNVPVTIGTRSKGGWPQGAWVDLTTVSVPTRTSTTLNLVITGNSQNVVLGGAVWAGAPIRPITIARGGVVTPTYGRSSTVNEYLTEYVVDYETRRRTFQGTVIAPDVSSRDLLLDWVDGSHGAARPALFIRNPDEPDAMLVYPPAAPRITHVSGTVQAFALTLTELSKGKPV